MQQLANRCMGFKLLGVWIKVIIASCHDSGTLISTLHFVNSTAITSQSSLSLILSISGNTPSSTFLSCCTATITSFGMTSGISAESTDNWVWPWAVAVSASDQQYLVLIRFS